MRKNRVYTLETKLEAIKLKNEGVPVKEIQKLLNIRSESQIYFWWYWYRDGEHHRLTQPIGKQYSYGHGPKGSTPEEIMKIRNRILQQQVKLLKKYFAKERKWYQKF